MNNTYSVVMPCLYRKEEHKDTVVECIDSVKDCSDDYEFIIVDDGSPLNTDFLKKSADVYIRHNEPFGIASGWNDGMRASKGDYIVIINDDIVAKPGWLECMRSALDQFPKAMVSAPAVEKMPKTTQGPHEYRVWFPGSCFMMRREAIDKVGYFDTQFSPFNYEDVDYWTRVYKKGYTLARDYSVEVGHKEGQVIHNVKNNEDINDKNRERYLKKWGFDPIPVFYEGKGLPWESG